MRALHIIMPMAGEGIRFLKEGWTTPKPLIKLNGKVLFQRAIESIVIDGVLMKYSFIVRQEHINNFQIDKHIRSIFPNANIFSVSKTTRGAVETCLIARSAIDPDDAIIVMDCDLEFKCNAYIEEIKNILNKDINAVNGGIIISFNAIDPRYSYAEIDKNNFVKRTAEKEAISNNALCGSYFFSKAESFFYAANSLLNDINFKKPELYVSLLYNYLLKNKESVKLLKVDKYYSYGTPDELKKYQ